MPQITQASLGVQVEMEEIKRVNRVSYQTQSAKGGSNIHEEVDEKGRDSQSSQSKYATNLNQETESQNMAKQREIEE